MKIIFIDSYLHIILHFFVQLNAQNSPDNNNNNNNNFHYYDNNNYSYHYYYNTMEQPININKKQRHFYNK